MLPFGTGKPRDPPPEAASFAEPPPQAVVNSDLSILVIVTSENGLSFFSLRRAARSCSPAIRISSSTKTSASAHPAKPTTIQVKSMREKKCGPGPYTTGQRAPAPRPGERAGPRKGAHIVQNRYSRFAGVMNLLKNSHR